MFLNQIGKLKVEIIYNDVVTNVGAIMHGHKIKTSQCIRKIGKDLERMRTNENKVERSVRTPF